MPNEYTGNLKCSSKRHHL